MGDLVLLRDFPDPEEAAVAASFLQSEGIAAVTGNVHFLTVNPMLRQAVGGFPLMVREENVQVACALLAGIEADARAAPAENACEACGAPSLRLQRDLLWSAVGFAWGVPFARRTGRAQCAACGAMAGADAQAPTSRIGLFLLGAALIAAAMWLMFGGFFAR